MLLNESGAAQTLGSFRAVTITAEVMLQSTIDAPSAGYVLALVSGRFFAHPPAGDGLQVNVFQYGLSANCSAPNIIDVDLRRAFIPDTSADVDWVHMISTQHLYEVSQGQKTICLVAKMVNVALPVGVTYEVLAITLTLIFIPTAYGTVDQL